MTTRPSRSQGDRDALDDHDLVDLDDRAGIDDGHCAEHIEEVMPS